MSARTTRILLWVHKWTGLITGINVLILSVTGAWLVFTNEIDLASPWMRGEVLGSVDMHGEKPLQAAIDFVKARTPAARPTVAFLPPFDAGAYHIGFSDGVRYRLDCESGAMQTTIQGDTAKLNAFMFQLHANLVQGKYGGFFIGGVGVLFFISTLTGLLIYGPFMKGALVNALRWDKGLRRASADLHKLVGSTSLVFNLIIGFTGVMLAFGLYVERNWQREVIVVQARPADPAQVGRPLPAADDVIRRVLSVAPGLEFYSLIFPGTLQGEGQYLSYSKRSGPAAFSGQVVTLTPLDLSAPRILETPFLAKVVLWCIPLHYGNFGGLGMKVVYAILSIGSGVLSISGAILSFSGWAKRWRMWRRGMGKGARAVGT